MNNLDSLEDGWYILRSKLNDQECLVKLYSFEDVETNITRRGFGFGTWDGGGFVQLDDILDTTEIIPIQIVSKICFLI